VQSQPDVEQFADGVEKDQGDVFEGIDQTFLQQTDLEGGDMPFPGGGSVETPPGQPDGGSTELP
jgi:hypothetical protein